MFVKNDQVPVMMDDGNDTPYDQKNIIFIRSKMNYGVKSRVQDAAAKIEMAQGGGTPSMDLMIGAYNIALLTENILAWRGPAFEGVPCDAQHIAELDPDEPLIDRVLAEINARNAKRTGDADPKELVIAGSAN